MTWPRSMIACLDGPLNRGGSGLLVIFTLALGAASCAGTPRTLTGGDADAAGFPRDAVDQPDGSDAQNTDSIEPPSDPPVYHGVVLAKLTQGADSDSVMAYAAFAAGGQPFAFTAPIGSHPATKSCSCVRGLATPILNEIVDASTISLATDAGDEWARRDPDQAVVDGGTVSFKLRGTTDLGASWYVFPGRYPPVAAGPLKAGGKLAVTAAGGTVDAFSGSITMGGGLSGVTPPLGAQDQSISRGADFQVSWTPDAEGGQTVLLSLRQVGAQSVVACFCEAADEAGTLTVPAELLALYEGPPASCDVQLARLKVSTVSRGNATVQLIAEAAVAGTATVE